MWNLFKRKRTKRLIKKLLKTIQKPNAMSPVDYYTGYGKGLCEVVIKMRCINEYSLEELNLLEEWLRDNLPVKNKEGFCWSPAAVAPRVKWLKEQLSKM